MKIFGFQSDRDNYHADAIAFYCIDNRFQDAIQGYLSRYNHVDPIRLAGGAKELAGNFASDQELMLMQIEKSVRMHGTPRVILFLHRDCGDYGGSRAFKTEKNGRNHDCEREHLECHLVKTTEIVKARFPELAVETYFVDFDGIHTPEMVGKGTTAIELIAEPEESLLRLTPELA